MKDQKGFIQILVSVLIIVVLFIVVLSYLNSTKLGTRTDINGDENATSSEPLSPKGIIDDARNTIEGFEETKNKEINDLLNNL